MISTQAKHYINQTDFYYKYYDRISEYHLVKGEKKRYLGSPKNRKCRFCGKESGDTTFNNKAHSLPELIGNRTLISNDECDICNKKFSTTIEDHFGKFSVLHRTLSRVSRKKNKGLPTFTDNKLRIDYKYESSEPDIYLDPDEQGNRAVEIREDKKQISIELKSQPYIPIAIYKCLTKMAISIMPESEISNFKEAIQWINMETHDSGILNYPLVCGYAFTDTVEDFDGRIHTLLLKRKTDNAPVPYMIYVLAFANLFFQIIVPYREEEHKNQELLSTWFPRSPYNIINYPPYPLPPYTTDTSGKYKYGMLNLSSKEQIQEPQILQCNYEYKE